MDALNEGIVEYYATADHFLLLSAARTMFLVLASICFVHQSLNVDTATQRSCPMGLSQSLLNLRSE